MKSTLQQIRERFDKDVERFSRLEIGNTAQVDSVLSLELIACAAAVTNPNARSVLDVGCGAGNYVLKILEKLPNLNVTLLDLSQPILQRALQRVTQATRGAVQTAQGDIREAQLGTAQFDVVVAAAVLHHLRAEDEWSCVFAKLHGALKPGGTLWIYDLVQHAIPEIEREMWQRYARHLVDVGGEAYREHVLACVEQEDTPRSLAIQLDQMRAAGFRDLEVLHKNVSFAAFGARK